MDSRQSLDATAISLMLVLCLIWALQQIVLKYTAQDITPMFQIGLRSGAAALFLALFMRWRGERMSFTDGTAWPGVLAGTLFALEFCLVGEGLRHTSAAHIVVFLYTAPIFAALGLHLTLPSERLAPLQWLGILLAFGGIAIAFFGRDQGAGTAPGNVLWGDFLGLLGGAFWGATTVVVRSTQLSKAPASQTLMYQLLGGFVVLTVFSVLSGQAHFNPTPTVWASLAFHAIIVAFLSFLVWFWLLRKYLASRLGVFSFLTPMFGILLGAWLLDERIEPAFLMGSLPVLIGIVLVSGHGWIAPALARLTGKRADRPAP
ncbi:MAG: DMT family transporter [Burkholderiaceae bacterium]